MGSYEYPRPPFLPRVFCFVWNPAAVLANSHVSARAAKGSRFSTYSLCKWNHQVLTLSNWAFAAAALDIKPASRPCSYYFSLSPSFSYRPLLLSTHPYCKEIYRGWRRISHDDWCCDLVMQSIGTQFNSTWVCPRCRRAPRTLLYFLNFVKIATDMIYM